MLDFCHFLSHVSFKTNHKQHSSPFHPHVKSSLHNPLEQWKRAWCISNEGKRQLTSDCRKDDTFRKLGAPFSMFPADLLNKTLVCRVFVFLSRYVKYDRWWTWWLIWNGRLPFLWQRLKRLAVRYISPLVHLCHWGKPKSCPRLDRCHGYCCNKPPVIGTCGCRAFWICSVRSAWPWQSRK